MSATEDITSEEGTVVMVVRQDVTGRLRFDSPPHAENLGTRDAVALRLARTATETAYCAVLDLDQENRLRRSVPAERKGPLQRTLNRLLEVLIESTYDRDVSAPQLDARLQVAVDTLDVVLRGDTQQLNMLIDSLQPADPPDDAADPEQAEARGRLRLQALYRRLIRESYTTEQLRAEFRLKRQRLLQLRNEDRLFAVEVPFHQGLLHPRWQFEESGRPRPEMPDLIAAARDAGLDAVAFHLLMTNPEAGDDGSPLDMLRDGRVEDILAIIRANAV